MTAITPSTRDSSDDSTRLRASVASSLPVPSARTLFAAAAVFTLTVLWFALAAHRPLANPDEGRYAEIPREMLALGDWITPHLNGLAYLEKPPLQYWTTALAYELLGVGEWTARSWTLLSAWLDVMLVYLLARRVWNARVGVIASALLASSVLHFAIGQILTLDMAFTFTMTATLCSFCRAQVDRESSPRSSARWMLATWLLLGCAVLTKGIVALVITGGVLSIYVLWQRDWTVLRTLRPITGPTVLIAVTAPWFIQVSRANSDFLQFFFVHEHLQRYLTDVAQRVEPWWYFIAILAAGALPWLPQMGSALLRDWRARAPSGQFDLQRLLWTWCVFILVFFSLSSSKLAPYILPMFPPLALLVASGDSIRSARALRFNVTILGFFAGALLVCCAAPRLVSKDPSAVQLARELQPVMALFVIVALAAAGVAWRAIERQRFDDAVLSVAVAWFLGLSMLFGTVGQEPLRSGKPLAARIPVALRAHAPIFSVQTYDQTLPFYLRRTLALVDMRGELDYGLRHSPAAAIDMAAFEANWRGLPQAVAIMSERTYSQLDDRGLPMHVLGRDQHRIAVSRR